MILAKRPRSDKETSQTKPGDLSKLKISVCSAFYILSIISFHLLWCHGSWVVHRVLRTSGSNDTQKLGLRLCLVIGLTFKNNQLNWSQRKLRTAEKGWENQGFPESFICRMLSVSTVGWTIHWNTPKCRPIDYHALDRMVKGALGVFLTFSTFSANIRTLKVSFIAQKKPLDICKIWELEMLNYLFSFKRYLRLKFLKITQPPPFFLILNWHKSEHIVM